MKSRKQIPTFICLLACLVLISCSKKESSAPLQLQQSALKNLPVLIDSRSQYELLDQFPSFPGGDSLFLEYFKTHLKYSSEASLNQIRGKIFASFIVETDGSVSEVAILKGLGNGLDEEVINTLKSMPVWSAGQIGEDKVRVKMVIPVDFR